jgi:hypothetical protein
MTNSEFNQLKYGNVITSGGFSGVPPRRLLVLHVKKNANGDVIEIGVIDSIRLADTADYTLVDATAEETLVVNGILQSKTI